MPEGYDTIVGERATRCPAARANASPSREPFIRNTPILILDEPSSGLDAASEKAGV